MPIVMPGGGRTVGADGPNDAKIVLIGEAPGATETNARGPKPFIGPAGGVLDTCLMNAQIIRATIKVTNLFKQRVYKRKKGNKDHYYIGDTLVYIQGKGATPNGMYAVHDLLNELATYSNATVFVPMGEAAIWALTGLFMPTRVRGSVYYTAPPVDNNPVPNVKVIPTVHPAAALHAYTLRYFIIYDLIKIREQAEFPEIRQRKRYFEYTPSASTVEAYLRDVEKNSLPQAVDIETYNGEIGVIGIGSDVKGIVIPTMIGAKHFYNPEDEIRVWNAVARYLGNRNLLKILHNATFDLWVFANNNSIVFDGPIFDTMVAFGLLYPDFEKKLHVLASLFSDIPYYKDEFKVWTNAELNRLDRMETLWGYNEKDVSATYQSWQSLKDEVPERGLQDIFDWDMRLIAPLVYMETRGMLVGIPELKELGSEVAVQIQEMKSELYEEVGRRINHNSSPQLQEYFYEELGVKPYYNRKTKKPTVDDDALKRLARGTASRPGIRAASLIKEIRSVGKLASTYLHTNLDHDGRIRCSLNPVGTKNGRLSSSQTLFGTGMNMQNLPQQFKKFLIADKDNLLIEIDKAQGEWVFTAFMSDDPNMIRIVENNEDAHVATAVLAFGVPKELVEKEAKVCKHETDPIKLRHLREKYIPEILEYSIPSSMTCRQAAKKANHGLNYAMGYQTFSLKNEISTAESSEIVEAYHRAYPSIRDSFHAGVRERLNNTRTLINPFGRLRTFYEIWGDALFKDGYAFGPQSGIADLINRGIVLMYEYCIQSDKGWARAYDPLMQVHDSVLFQCHVPSIGYDGMAELIIKQGELLDPLITWEGKDFRVRNDVSVGRNWGGYHDKENPRGMLELDWTEDPVNMAQQLKDAHEKLAA